MSLVKVFPFFFFFDREPNEKGNLLKLSKDTVADSRTESRAAFAEAHREKEASRTEEG